MNGEAIGTFRQARTPEVVFGAGTILGLGELCTARGWQRLAVVSGGRSFEASGHAERLRKELRAAGIEYSEHHCSGEPSPGTVDGIVDELGAERPDAVAGIGGGSVIDTGKAVAAALCMPGSVKEYLEGVGSTKPTGETLPYIACPTTAGTGSEATKNAVLSEVGEGGFKKSLRHDAFIPQVAILDPELGLGAPSLVTAGSGLDAVTQLLEAYLSTNATPITDAYAESGLAAAGRSFERVLENPNDLDARADMAYAAYCSGVCLANAGLGVVHGAASPAGALTGVPHGVFCGSLLEPSVRRTVERLGEQTTGDDAAARALRRYAWAGQLLQGGDELYGTADPGIIVERLQAFARAAQLPGLGEYGFDEQMLKTVAGKSGAKNHPVPLPEEDIAALIRDAL
jgi:alcohol dehydrogenase